MQRAFAVATFQDNLRRVADVALRLCASALKIIPLWDGSDAWIKHLEDVIAQKGMVQVKLEDAKISEEQIYSRPGRTVVAEAKWILTHKAVLVPVKDLPISETVKKIKFVNFYWEPPVTLSVGAKGYLGVLTAKEIETKFSKVEFSKESLFHVFCGQLMNAGAMSEYVNKKSKGASDER